MKIKEMLRFYFSAEKINSHIDRQILKYACNPEVDALDGAERISALIDEKGKLKKLWAYLDGVAGGLKSEEFDALKSYSAMREGLKKLGGDEIKRIRSAGTKFMRHARRLDSFGKELRLLRRYYCLL
ncbi:MAG: hypothetical protein K2L12_07355 [Clostridia bacterium]|nr:hypothetical protein [Clostridia bacterium]